MRNKPPTSTGFTLIELLIVMMIIISLATLFLTSFPGALKSARDSQRKSDLKQYQTALESFANRGDGFYPSGYSGVNADSLCAASIMDIDGCPQDPISSNPRYRYYSNGNFGLNNATQYVIVATLEKSDNPGTTYRWVVCSNGQSGRTTSGWFPNGTCPGGLLP
jgi:prepilin-type N-terminal cleavage/methylation domain-containing protein